MSGLRTFCEPIIERSVIDLKPITSNAQTMQPTIDVGGAIIHPVVDWTIAELESRYKCGFLTIRRRRQDHGFETPMGPNQIVPNEEREALDRFLVFTSRKPWGFRLTTKRYFQIWNSPLFDETACDYLPDDYRKMDHWLLTNRQINYTQHIEQWQTKIFGN